MNAPYRPDGKNKYHDPEAYRKCSAKGVIKSQKEASELDVTLEDLVDVEATDEHQIKIAFQKPFLISLF